MKVLLAFILQCFPNEEIIANSELSSFNTHTFTLRGKINVSILNVQYPFFRTSVYYKIVLLMCKTRMSISFRKLNRILTSVIIFSLHWETVSYSIHGKCINWINSSLKASQLTVSLNQCTQVHWSWSRHLFMPRVHFSNFFSPGLVNLIISATDRTTPVTKKR